MTITTLNDIDREIAEAKDALDLPAQAYDERIARLNRQRERLFRDYAVEIMGEHRRDDCERWSASYLSASLRHHGIAGRAIVRAFYGGGAIDRDDAGAISVVRIDDRSDYHRSLARLNGIFETKLAALLAAQNDILAERARLAVAFSKLRRAIRRERAKAEPSR